MAPRQAAETFALGPFLRTFLPHSPRYRRADFLRGAVGAFLGIVVASLVARALAVGTGDVPFIVAPMGATAVLLFAAPASPLAQPWAVVGGNVTSTLVGVAAGRAIDDTTVAAASAVAVAIALMMALRCVHPPGGACALFAAVGGPAVHDQGYAFAVWPVAINSVLLLAVAVLVNNLTGRTYPHAPAVAATTPGSDPAPSERVGVGTADIEQAMARLDQGLDVLPGDVLALVRDAEAHALDRQLGQLRCEAVMARDVETVLPTESVYRVRLLMNQHHVKAVPVVDEGRRVVGIITVYDLFNLDIANLDTAAKVMSSPVTSIHAGAPVAELVSLMTDLGLRHVPVVDDAGHLVGIVTRTELIAVLNQALLSAHQAD